MILLFGPKEETYRVILKINYICLNDTLNLYYLYTFSAVASNFDSLRINNFPNVIGAIDGCHIRITVPLNKRKDYTNRKMFQSIVLLVFIIIELLNVFVNVLKINFLYNSRLYVSQTLNSHMCLQDGLDHLTMHVYSRIHHLENV